MSAGCYLLFRDKVVFVRRERESQGKMGWGFVLGKGSSGRRQSAEKQTSACPALLLSALPAGQRNPLGGVLFEQAS